MFGKKKDFDPNYRNKDGQSYLHIFAAKGNLTAIYVFSAAGAKVNLQDNDGLTPLHFAAFNGHIPAVRDLFNAGADPHIKDYSGRTARDLAVSKNYQLLVKYMDRHVKKMPHK